MERQETNHRAILSKTSQDGSNTTRRSFMTTIELQQSVREIWPEHAEYLGEDGIVYVHVWETGEARSAGELPVHIFKISPIR
jgi:hypothetical protein